MTHELVLTSVEQGLDPNNHGFCPVAVDSSISPRVFQHLLTLNSYRHLVTTSEEAVRRNPVAYSHLMLPGDIEHVLSRVADAGTDYQNQPNVLAHHVVLEGTEAPPEGPGWLLALPCFHLTEWTGPVLQFTQGRPLPTQTIPPSLTRRQQIAREHHWLDPQKMALIGSVDAESESYRAAVQSNEEQIALIAPPTSPCPVWAALTGDPGWGGVLAETAFTGQPVVLIYHPEQNILPLYVEALALLPPYFSWRVTFCTYFTGLPEMISCQWKGVLAGSEEAKQLAKDTNNLILDITQMMGEAPTGKYVDFARQGQEYMLPQETEETVTILANADTKPYEGTKSETDKSNTTLTILPNKMTASSIQTILFPKGRTGLSELFLRRTSRFQFYLLYSIMFILVLVLLVLAIDQSSDHEIRKMLQNWIQPSNRMKVEEPEAAREAESALDIEAEAEWEQDQTERPILTETENFRKTFEENREKQKTPLLRFLDNFDIPEFLAINFPDIQDNHIHPPVKRTFRELSLLQPFGAALELRFIPLFELPKMKVETRQVLDALPLHVWKVEAIDTETHEETPMFLFQLTESGLEMEWQLEGLNTQHLYDTLLSSLGFLQLNIAGMPETTKQISLFEPVETKPMKISALAGLSETETPEFVEDLPFASELWQNIFAEMNPPKTLHLEVQAEPTGHWIRRKPSPPWEFHADIWTSQQAGKLMNSGETLFENIEIPLVALASFDKIIWKVGEYAEQLQREQESLQSAKAEWEKKVEQLKAKIFDGNANETDRNEREKYEAELKKCDLHLKQIENILEKLPEAYKEIGQNETAYFHYSVFLESAEGKRRLLILTTHGKKR